MAVDSGLPRHLTALGISKNYPRNTILHHQDDVQTHICYIQSGRVFAVATDIEGNESWITEYTPGQFIGSNNLFAAKVSAPYYLIAKTPVTGVLFPIDGFTSLMNEHAELSNLVTADLGSQLNRFAEQILEVNALSVHGRIASELKRQSKPIGKDPGTYIIRPTPVFSELAQRLGSSRETVSRAVSKMVKKGIMERRTGALIVPNIYRLEDEIA